MWRKIHSNRDPRDTLFSELKKEFSPYLFKVHKGMRSVLKNYPRFFFGGMTASLLLSAVLSFTVFRHPDHKPQATIKERPDPVGEGFSRIMKATGELLQTLQLKHTVDSLTAKKQLTSADSLALDSALDCLRIIHTNANQ
ncbi:hypothetical protein [Mucilaginibacter agri]|uniref:Uncharacterized protein n=1 Tax=Mucilaginibacter agri TaxID=2695265 RepID=A0A965ZE21_9SPHI|nr:hypothetical protein [Mucilaginibacter agri]NCD68294.1 hypothetical protein [Mucilaginibacter agri]